jgi:hypothetical protein
LDITAAEEICRNPASDKFTWLDRLIVYTEHHVCTPRTFHKKFNITKATDKGGVARSIKYTLVESEQPGEVVSGLVWDYLVENVPGIEHRGGKDPKEVKEPKVTTMEGRTSKRTKTSKASQGAGPSDQPAAPAPTGRHRKMHVTQYVIKNITMTVYVYVQVGGQVAAGAAESRQQVQPRLLVP